MFRVVAGFLMAAVLAVPATAQETLPPERDDEPLVQSVSRNWNFWLRGNGQLYENFDQAPDGAPENTVTALAAEVGANVGLTPALRAYATASYLQFNEDELEGSSGFRAGLRGDMRPHAFEVYAEQLTNRPSFDLDVFAGAQIRRLAGEYSYRFLENWQASAEVELDRQDFERSETRDNEFAGFGAAIRWRGSRLISPELGFRTGRRDVNDDLQTYDQGEVYLQVRSSPTEKLYLSARVRERRRDYANVDREDNRRQLAVSADYSFTDAWVLNLYGARERNDTNLANRDATWGFFSAGVTYRF